MLPAIAAAYLAMAMMLGGGGAATPIAEMMLQLVAALAAAAWLIAASRQGMPAMPADRTILAIAAMVVALPLLQLLPLPPAIWQWLPGREQEVAALRLVGADANWMPWSMTPARTIASLLAALPALLAMGMVASLDLAGRRLAIAAIAAVALASLVLGALQLASGESGAWRLYGKENIGYLTGFQGNRDIEADVLLIGLAALAAVLAGMRKRIGERMAAIWLLAGGSLLALGCLTTGSRAGNALLPVALLAAGAIWLGRRPGLRAVLAGGGLIAAAAAGLFVLARFNGRVANAIGRFSFTSDPRQDIWADTIYAISRHWPFGSGMGSFKPIFIAAERLEFVDPFYPTAAHNDYLELALEGGIFGLGLLLAIVVLIAWKVVKSLRGAGEEARSQLFVAVNTLIIVASHSVVDYPLRSMAIASIAGAAVGLLSALPACRETGELPAK